MQAKSSDFVKIIYFNKKKVRVALKKFAKVLKARKEVEEVVLFGSFLRGNVVPGSDVDLLIILKESELPFLERIPQYLPTGFPVGVDVFPYTRAEIEKMLRESNFFIKRVLREGKRL